MFDITVFLSYMMLDCIDKRILSQGLLLCLILHDLSFLHDIGLHR